MTLLETVLAVLIGMAYISVIVNMFIGEDNYYR